MAKIVLTVKPKNKYMAGSNEFTATAGQNVVIETSPGGEDILDETVPEGHEWACKVWIEITESEV